jgi:hypothetical protein
LDSQSKPFSTIKPINKKLQAQKPISTNPQYSTTNHPNLPTISQQPNTKLNQTKQRKKRKKKFYKPHLDHHGPWWTS